MNVCVCLSNDAKRMNVCFVMDFYHVLPSNASPDYFPNNKAAHFSTQLDNPYNLLGNWEVGLMDFTYSPCVDTFNNDEMSVTETNEIAPMIRKTKRAYKVMLPVPTNPADPVGARSELAGHINNFFKTLLQVNITSDALWAEWNLLTDDFYFALSPKIEAMFQLFSDVLTTMDASFKNELALSNTVVPTEQSDVYIIIALSSRNPFCVQSKRLLKKAGEKIDSNQLLQRFQQQIPSSIATLTMNTTKQFRLYKTDNDDKMILVNEPLRKALTFQRAGMFCKAYQQHYAYDFSSFADEWTFTYITFASILVFPRKVTKTITLPPISFNEESKAMDFVNSKVNDQRIMFSCDAAKHVTLNVKDEHLSLTLDANLRDIFGFDSNTFVGKKSYIARRTFSLNRCIQFLYIYSNISDYVRIGNTQAPLLAIVPFKTKDGCSSLKEKIFKTPMYIPVKQNQISQIDIGIYDGAGQLVPFVTDSKTILRLHFRPI